MANVQQPLFGLGAHGSLGRVLTYQGKTRGYRVGKLPIPKQPHTASQGAVQLYNSFFTADWSTRSDPDKASWKSAGDAQNQSPYHAFLKANLNRAQQLKAGSQKYPITEADPPPPWIQFQAVNLPDQTTVAYISYTPTPLFHAIFYRFEGTNRAPHPNEAVAIAYPSAPNQTHVLLPDLPSGTFTFRAVFSMPDGYSRLLPEHTTISYP